LQRSSWHFIKSQASTIVRLYAFYEPLRTFSYIALPFLMTGIILLTRFLILFIIGERGIGRFTQSVSIGVGMLLVGVIIALFGIQADIAGKHRQLTQEVLYRLKKQQLDEAEDIQKLSGKVELLTDQQDALRSDKLDSTRAINETRIEELEG
jgi:hypothetical protein